MVVFPEFVYRSVLGAADALTHHPMMRRLRFLEQAQWWDRERIQRHQCELLRKTLQVAYNEVPFYRSLFEESGVHPDDVQSAGDLRRLPIVTKSMLRENYPHRTVRDTGRRAWESRTSGSTGTNFAVLEDMPTAGWYRATFMLMLEWAGWRFGQPHVQMGIAPDRSGPKAFKDAFLNCRYVSAFDLTDAAFENVLQMMERQSIRHLWGYPGGLYHLALYAARRGWNQKVDTLISWGDNLYPHYRAAIEGVFKNRILDTYGCSEGTHISGQCGYEQNYHVHDLDVVAEYVDDDGNPVPQDEPGHILFTRLHPGPMPLIRYKIGDVGIAGSQEPCPCGRGFSRMHSVQGRETDIVITPSGNRIVVHCFNAVLENITEIGSYQVRQETSDMLRILVVPNGNFTEETTARICGELRSRGMHDMQITVEQVSEIPVPPSGKRRFVLNLTRMPRPAGMRR